MFFAKPLLGLDVGSGMIKAVALERKNGKVAARQAGIAAMPGGAFSEGTPLDATAASDFIRRFCRQQGLGGDRVAVAVAGSDVFLTRLRMLPEGGRSWKSRVLEEAARELPLPPEQLHVDYQMLEESPEAAEALVVAARREKVSSLRDMLRRAGKTAVVVDAAACALANAFEFNHEPDGEAVAALVNIGAETVTVSVVRGATPLVSRDLTLAGGGFSAEDWSLADRVAAHVERVFEALDELAEERPLQPRSSSVGRLWLSGGGARMAGLEQTLRARFRMPIEESDPFRRI